MGEKEERGHTGEPPMLTGGVWRLREAGNDWSAIAVRGGQPEAFWWTGEEWRPYTTMRIVKDLFGEWAMAERARADGAEEARRIAEESRTELALGFERKERELFDRAERAEKVAAAERALRKAIFVGYSGPCDEHVDEREPGCFQCAADKVVNEAGEALRALGVEP